MELGIIPSNLLVAKASVPIFGKALPKFCGNSPDRLFCVRDKKTKEDKLKIEVGSLPVKLFSESLKKFILQKLKIMAEKLNL